MDSPSPGPSHGTVERYSNVAVAFHWLTAILVIAQIWLGFGFHAAERGSPRQMELFTWHKTVGALILGVVLLRLAYRLVNRPPPFPADLPRCEQFAAIWNHRIFYLLLIALPLTGLVAISDGAKEPTTSLVGGLPLPLIPGISKATGDMAGDIHVVILFLLIAAILIHAVAALKHQFIDRTPSSGRMPPFTVPDRS